MSRRAAQRPAEIAGHPSGLRGAAGPPHLTLGAGALALAFCAAACAAPTEETTAVRTIRVTTGLPGAGFNPLGAALTQALDQALPDLAFEMLESEGAVSNVEALQRGSADLGLAFSDVAYVGYVGQLSDESGRLDNIRGIAVLHETPVHLVVRDARRIQGLADLHGRHVGVGPAGSGTTLTAALLLKAFGLSRDEVVQTSLPFMEQARRLVDGELDAVFVTAGHPAESVLFAARAGGTLLDVSGPRIEQLRGEYPFLRMALIPGGTYPGQRRPIRTVGVYTLLVCRTDLDEALVYRLTRTVFDVLPRVASRVPALRRMDLGRAEAMPIPLHRGAARHYREREVFR